MLFNEINKILVINLGGIGDIILSSGALKALRKRYCSARIDLLSVPRCKDLMERYGIFNNLYEYPGNNAFKLAGLIFKLRKNRYDLVINMRTIVGWPGALKMFVIFKGINGRFAAGRNTENRGFFFDASIPETYKAENFEYLYDVNLLKAIGVPVDAVDIDMPVNADDIRAVSSILAKVNITTDDFLVGINPGGQPSRRWPENNFISLIKQILASYNCKIILTGSSEERALCERILRAVEDKRLFNFAGAITLNQFAHLIRQFKIFISNDTGSMHVCVVNDTPAVFLFGGGNSIRFGPYKNPEKYIVLQKKMHCSPCEKINCRHNKCMKAITVSEVYESFKILKEKYSA